MLTALNFDTQNARTIICSTSFCPHTQLHDYTGRHGDVWTDAEGRATFTIPSNAFSRGQSYLCFSHSGINVPNPAMPRSTTQTIFGAADLDIGPAHNAQILTGRITAERDLPITVKVRPDRTGWQANSELRILLTDTADRAVIDFSCANDEGVAQGRTLEAGEYSLSLLGSHLPEDGSGLRNRHHLYRSANHLEGACIYVLAGFEVSLDSLIAGIVLMAA